MKFNVLQNRRFQLFINLLILNNCVACRKAVLLCDVVSGADCLPLLQSVDCHRVTKSHTVLNMETKFVLVAHAAS
jgi:hypothetical protein